MLQLFRSLNILIVYIFSHTNAWSDLMTCSKFPNMGLNTNLGLMGTAAAAYSGQITINGVVLSGNTGTYTPGSIITVGLSPFTGQLVFQANSGALFQGAAGKRNTNGLIAGCTAVSRYQMYSNSAASLKMPASGTVKIECNYATQTGTGKTFVTTPVTLTAAIPPTFQPSFKPTLAPTSLRPTLKPTLKPTFSPSTFTPTLSPSYQPTIFPTINPTFSPTFIPTKVPTVTPTIAPITSSPSYIPSNVPSRLPTMIPSVSPTMKPTYRPTLLPGSPTLLPTSTINPTSYPSQQPSILPTFTPTQPSSSPSQRPTYLPTIAPSLTPSFVPSIVPTFNPSKSPTSLPTMKPSLLPSIKPSTTPSCDPSSVPSFKPSTESPTTKVPSFEPTNEPTLEPTIEPTTTSQALPKTLIAVSQDIANIDMTALKSVNGQNVFTLAVVASLSTFGITSNEVTIISITSSGNQLSIRSQAQVAATVSYTVLVPVSMVESIKSQLQLDVRNGNFQLNLQSASIRNSIPGLNSVTVTATPIVTVLVPTISPTLSPPKDEIIPSGFMIGVSGAYSLFLWIVGVFMGICLCLCIFAIASHSHKSNDFDNLENSSETCLDRLFAGIELECNHMCSSIFSCRKTQKKVDPYPVNDFHKKFGVNPWRESLNEMSRQACERDSNRTIRLTPS